MGWKQALVGAFIGSLVAGCASAPPALPQSVSALPDTHRAAAVPAGFTSFCTRFPDQCTAGAQDKQQVTLDLKTWLLLINVNKSVNESIWPEDDSVHYGRAEYWTIPTDGYGDCDDYALTKRQKLQQAGLPELALRIAVVYSARSGRHAVLTVATDKGDLVLDNLTQDIVPWHATDYHWIERQDATNPMKWVSLQPIYVAQDDRTPTKPDTVATAGSNIPTSSIGDQGTR